MDPKDIVRMDVVFHNILFAGKKVKVGTNYLNSHGLNGIRVNQ